jgi:PEP-CTERM motif
MKIRLLTKIILCGALAVGAHATPINFSHIGDPQSGRQTNSSTASQSSTASSDTVNASLTIESLEQPEFVRLADGRMIPYGPGVICSESCVESVVEPQGFPRKWLIALPIAGAAIIGVLLASDATRIPRTAVDSITQPPTTTPSPTPTPVCTSGNCTPTPVEPVPEPATLALMGAGLAVMSRRRVMELIKRQKK